MSNELTIITKEKIKNKEIGFDYNLVDKETGDFMKQATENIFLLREKTKKALGEQFSIVQNKLTGNNQYNSLFGKWYTALGFKKDFVYDCINYYEMLIANSENQMLQKLSFSKVCEVAKLKDNNELQKEVIKKAPLKDMKVKQVIELVKEVKEKNEVTDELIEEICSKTNEAKTNIDKFVKVTTSFIDDLKKQKEKMTEDNFEEIMKLVEEVKELCSKTKKLNNNEIKNEKDS